MAKTYTTHLLRKENIARDTWQFVFEKPGNYHFFAGQYQTIFLDMPDGKIDSRDMTIASSPLEKELRWVTKIEVIHSPFKKALRDLAIGSPIILQGPAGGFYLREEDTTWRVFLAGGIGITPFYSMISYVAEKQLPIPMSLFVSFSTEEDIILYDELQKYKKAENIQIVYALTNPCNGWTGEKGRISDTLIQKYIPDVNDVIFMIAGSQKMIDDTNEILLGMGVHSENIKLDYFTGY